MLQLSIIFMAMTFVVFTGYGVFAAGARGRIRLGMAAATDSVGKASNITNIKVRPFL